VFECPVCGSLGQSDKLCGVCGTRLDKAGQPPPFSSTVGNGNPKRSIFLEQSRPYWTVAKILVLLLVVVAAVSAVGAGSYYYAARQAGPNCANGTTNYPTCDSCPSGQMSHYNVTPSCHCTNGTHNPPSCDEPCANGAINPPACDQCPDHQTDTVCSPPMTAETYTVPVDFGVHTIRHPTN
jgi:hypothetical protein